MRFMFPCLLFCPEKPHKPLEIEGLPESLGSFWSLTFGPFQVLISYSSSHPELEAHWPPVKGRVLFAGTLSISSLSGTQIKQTRVPLLPETQCILQGCCSFVFIRLYQLSVLCSHSVAIFFKLLLFLVGFLRSSGSPREIRQDHLTPVSEEL